MSVEIILTDILVKAGSRATAPADEPVPYNVAWIRELRKAFEGRYCPLGMTVRSRHAAANKHDEFLYDLIVCHRLDPVYSPKDGKKSRQQINRVGRPEWQVESELSSNSQHIAHDFNKLLIGGAKHKLMICGQRGGTRSGESQTEALNEFFLELLEDFNDISLFVAYLTPWKQQGTRNPGPRWMEGESPLEELWDFSNKNLRRLSLAPAYDSVARLAEDAMGDLAARPRPMNT